MAQGARVILLSRDASKLKDVPSAVKTASVDYTNEAQVALVLKEHAVDVVIISLANGSETTNGSKILTVVQVGISRAAKEAGVKLFLPNEFGPETEGYGPGSVFGDQNEAFGMSIIHSSGLNPSESTLNSQDQGSRHCYH